jgi:hypothetical protein
MENKPKKFMCIKTMMMSNGRIGFKKRKSYYGRIDMSGYGNFKSEVCGEMVHGMYPENISEYLFEFKYGK